MATKAREGIGTDCSATVIHGENPTGKPQAVATDANGILLAKLDGVTIEHAHLDVQLKANEVAPAESDSVIACGTTDGAIAGPPKAIKVGADGTVQVAGAVTTSGTVTEASASAIKTAVEKAATEITVGQGAPSRPFLPATSGGTPAQQQGVSGRLPQDITYTLAAGKTITIHPKRAGVSVSVATAGAAAVSATSLAVTLTNKNDDSTTVAAMQALIAASASVAALVSISGTALDTFDHTLTLADTPLWYNGTIAANVMAALGSDGYFWPVEMDATGGIKTSDSSLHAGEDVPTDVTKIEHRYSCTDSLTADTQIKASAGFVHSISFCCTGIGGNNKISLYDNTAAAGTPKWTAVLTGASNGPLPTVVLDAAFGTGIYLDFDGATGNATVTWR